MASNPCLTNPQQLELLAKSPRLTTLRDLRPARIGIRSPSSHQPAVQHRTGNSDAEVDPVSGPCAVLLERPNRTEGATTALCAVRRSRAHSRGANLNRCRTPCGEGALLGQVV